MLVMVVSNLYINSGVTKKRNPSAGGCAGKMQQDRQSHSVLPISLLQPGVNPVLGLESPVLDHSEDQGKKSNGLNTRKKRAGKIRCYLGAQCLKKGKKNP